MFLSAMATSCGSPIFRKALYARTVEFQGLLEAVLAVENVAHVGVQPGQPQPVAQPLEDLRAPAPAQSMASS